MAHSEKASSTHQGACDALKEEMHRALSHMPGYGEHFSDADVGIDVTKDRGDFAVYLFAREPEGLSGTSMQDAPQQWHDEMNARESAVSALRDMLMNGPNIHDAEFDTSDELYGSKGDFVAALNTFFKAKGLAQITNPLLVAEKDKAKRKPAERAKPAERDTSLENQIRSKFVAWMMQQGQEAPFFDRHGAKDAATFLNRAGDAISVALEERDGKLALRIDCDGRMLAGTTGFYEEVNAKMDFTDLANKFVEQLGNEIRAKHPEAGIEVASCDYVYAKHLDPVDNKERIAHLKQNDPGALATDISGKIIEWVSDMSDMDELVSVDDSRITAPKEHLLEAIGSLSAIDPAALIVAKTKNNDEGIA